MKTCMFLLLQLFGGDQDSCEKRPEMKVRIWHNFSHDEVLDRDEITGWSLAVPELLHFAADKGILGNDPECQSTGERILRSFGVIAPLVVIESSIAGASHEYGHFRAFSMAGMRHYKFVNENDDSDRFSANPFNAFSTQLLKHWFGGDNYAASISDSDWQEFQARLPRSAERHRLLVMWDAVMEAGGLNQNQYNAETMSEKMLDGKAHFLDGVTYYSNLLSTLLYPAVGGNSDILDYVEDVRELGIKTSVNEVKWYSQIPKLVSNSTLSFLVGAVDFWLTGDKLVEPLKLELGECAIYWPEFASYLTLHGPTVKVGERIGWQDQVFTLSLERSLSDEMWEAGISWKGRITDFLSCEARIIHNFGENGTWLEGGPTIRLFSWLAVGIKAYYGDGYTFNREMVGQVPSFLEEKEFGVKAFVEVNVKY